LEISNEKRRAKRLKVNFEVPGLGEAQDISSEGMCLLVKNPFAVGNRLDLEFRPLPEASLVKCEAEVIWHRQLVDGRIKVGLKFIWTNAAEEK
jgi:hypothetical protein